MRTRQRGCYSVPHTREWTAVSRSYGRAVLDAAKGSEHLTKREVSTLKREMAGAPDELEHKPYMRLKKVAHHRWGGDAGLAKVEVLEKGMGKDRKERRQRQ